MNELMEMFSAEKAGKSKALRRHTDRKVFAAILALLLLCYFAIAPVFGAENPDTNKKLKVFDKNGKEVQQAVIPDTSNTEKEDSDQEEKKDDSESSSPSIMNIGSKMVGEGGIYFLEMLGDAGFNAGANDTDTVTVKENYGNAVALIYTLATIEFDPSSSSFIKEVQLRFSLIGLFLILLFIILGAVNVNIFTMTSGKNSERAWILSNRYHIPINEYALTLIEACILMVAGYILLRITIVMELMFTKLIMIQILDRIMPTGGNIVMYLMMSLCYLCIATSIAYRILIIAFFHATYVAWIGLYCFGVTREAAISAFWYYLKMLFMRTIIVAVTVIGVGVISTIHLSTNTLTSDLGNATLMLIVQPILYVALVLILLIVCITFILGIRRVMAATNYAVRKGVKMAVMA
jgi:hypothetical protein